MIIGLREKVNYTEDTSLLPKFFGNLTFETTSYIILDISCKFPYLPFHLSLNLIISFAHPESTIKLSNEPANCFTESLSKIMPLFTIIGILIATITL